MLAASVLQTAKTQGLKANGENSEQAPEVQKGGDNVGVGDDQGNQNEDAQRKLHFWQRWVAEKLRLSDYNKTEPQAAYGVFIYCIKQKN